jgi:hypothetical protein
VPYLVVARNPEPSDVTREAVERFLAQKREAEIDRQIVEAYTRQPPNAVWSDEPARQIVASEPW